MAPDTVQVDDQGKAVSCPCKGWEHRQHCRHLGEAEQMHRAEEAKSTHKKGAAS